MMSEAKFTDGPWQVTVDFDAYHEVGPQNERQTMITCDHNKYIGVDRNEALANAHLIATAPEMYDMITVMLEQFGNEEDCINEYDYVVIREAKNLLAKARGEK